MIVNRINEAEEERLGLFTEEMGEEQQVIGKILRHGLDSRSPIGPQGPDNKGLLEIEGGHVLAAIDLLMARGTINRYRVEDARIRKLQKLTQWLHAEENLQGVKDLLVDALREQPALGRCDEPSVDPLLMEVCDFLRALEGCSWTQEEVAAGASRLCTKVSERMASRLGPYFTGLGREGR